LEPAENKGKTFDLTDEVTVGRASGCQVALSDPTVSQLHARIFRRDGRLFVEDLGSSNGTYVNRKKVSSPVAIRRGDRLSVGSTVLELTR
ncbi:MAG: FHA domain-containing protein, partial [Actinobacteria bacterium]|nr:FHA domain-containing protein [Actinomycetota bacterium]